MDSASVVKPFCLQLSTYALYCDSSQFEMVALNASSELAITSPFFVGGSGSSVARPEVGHARLFG